MAPRFFTVLSFFVALVLTCVGLPRSSANAQTAEAMKLDVCPDSYADFPEGGPSLTCGCSAEAAKAGSVYGANPYMWQSNVCRAALHAGAIGPKGGQVSVTFAKAPLFPAVTRYGVSSSSNGADKGFLVAVTAAAATSAPDAAGMALDGCPDSYA